MSDFGGLRDCDEGLPRLDSGQLLSALLSLGSGDGLCSSGDSVRKMCSSALHLSALSTLLE